MLCALNNIPSPATPKTLPRPTVHLSLPLLTLLLLLLESARRSPPQREGSLRILSAPWPHPWNLCVKGKRGKSCVHTGGRVQPGWCTRCNTSPHHCIQVVWSDHYFLIFFFHSTLLGRNRSIVERVLCCGPSPRIVNVWAETLQFFLFYI